MKFEHVTFLAYAVSFFLLMRFKKMPLSKTWIVPFFSVYFGISFAGLFYVFLNGADSGIYKDGLIATVFAAFKPISKSTGRVLFGSYFGSIFGIYIATILLRKRKELFPELLNISSISISLLYFVWRTFICARSGCCFGRPTSLPWGVTFPKSESATKAYMVLKNISPAFVEADKTVPLVPTQIISGIGDLSIFIFLLTLYLKKKFNYPYFYFFAFSLLYGLGRFTIEFFRIDPREMWGMLSMSQYISLGLITVSLYYFISNRKEIFCSKD